MKNNTAQPERIEPLHDRVVVERIPEKQSGLIVIPDAYKDTTHFAKVLAVGPGKWGDDGYFYKTAVKPGDVVALPGIARKIPDWEKKDTILIQEADIGGILG